MQVCAALMNIGTSGVTGDTAALSFPAESSADLAWNASFNPTQAVAIVNVADTPTLALLSWINPVWELIASAFVRYQIRKMTLEYMPQSASTQSDQLVCAFANDPLHPVIGIPPILTMGYSLTNQQLLGLSDSVPFMPWREWSMDLTPAYKNDQPFFVARGDYPAEPSSLRFSDAGVIAVTNSGTATSPLTYGVLYLKSEIEFLEFCPILPYTLSTNLARSHTRSTSVPPKEDKEENPCGVRRQQLSELKTGAVCHSDNHLVTCKARDDEDQGELQIFPIDVNEDSTGRERVATPLRRLPLHLPVDELRQTKQAGAQKRPDSIETRNK